MFKYLIVLAFAVVCVLAAAPEAPKDDQETASQFYYGGYPSVYSNYGYRAAYPYAAVGHYNTYSAYPYAHHGGYFYG